MTDKKLNETAAADTLKPGSSSTKAQMMADAMLAMAGMSKQDLTHFLNDSLAQIGKEAQHIPAGAAERNKATIAAMKEDINEMFGDDLSEELKDKAATLFEAAVNARVSLEVANLQEQMQDKLNEQVDARLEEVAEAVEKYLDYTADKWMADNKLQIESSLRLQIAEEFMQSLRGVFLEHYIEIPESQTNVVDVLTNKVDELEAKLNELINDNIALAAALSEKEMDAVIEQFAEGLTVEQTEKFKKLSEDITYKNVDELKAKLATIKETYFKIKTPKTDVVTEESVAVSEDELKTELTEETKSSPHAKTIAAAISRLSKNTI